MVKFTLAVSLLFAITLISGCGGNSAPADYFPVSVGTHWEFVTPNGTHSFIDFEAAPDPGGCLGSTGNIIMVMSKDAPDGYPWPGFSAASHDRMTLHQEADGTWLGSVDNFTVDSTIGTINWGQVEGKPTPIIFLPGQSSPMDSQTVYDLYQVDGSFTQNCIEQPQNLRGQIQWESKFYHANVDTPIYSGDTLVWESREQWHDFSNRFAHEFFYFAPNLGVVQVSTVGPDEAAITVKRTR